MCLDVRPKPYAQPVKKLLGAVDIGFNDIQINQNGGRLNLLDQHGVLHRLDPFRFAGRASRFKPPKSRVRTYKIA